MKLSNIMSVAGRNLSVAKLKISKHSPELLMIAGIVGGVASAVMACKATTKVSEILDSTSEAVNTIHHVEKNPPMGSNYTHEDAQKDLFITYVQTGAKLVKLYGPSLALGALSITSILASHNILHKRNVAIAAAYTAVDKGFKDYRGRVIERFGDELDKELKYNIKAKKIEEKVVDEKGKEKKVKKDIQVVDYDRPGESEYARFFDNGNTGWDENPEFSLKFLIHQQDWANELLNHRGYVFLNEVYDMLGIPRTKAGQIVGWVKNNKDENADHYIDFGIFNVNRPKSRDFVNGYENVILLDFNVDGPILDLI